MKRTPLYGRHVALGAKMTGFGGFEMPLEYAGITPEHLAVRQSAGVFDVSHMGEFVIEGPDALVAVNHLVTNIITEDLEKVTYALMTDHDGKVIDDLLVYVTAPDNVLLVVNAGNIDKDFRWVKQQLSGMDVNVSDISDDMAQIAIQGPDALSLVKDIVSYDPSDMPFMTWKTLGEGPSRIFLSRTGYTGEDGVEIYGSPDVITDLWDKTLAKGVVPCGLGARDTLRFEANLPLYGNEIGGDINPVEAGLKFAVKTEKEFIGKDALLSSLASPVKKVVGLSLEGRGIPRHGYPVLFEGREVGHITTGYMLPTQDNPIALAAVDIEASKIGTMLEVSIRNRMVPARVRNRKFHQKNTKKQEVSS
jgi:aminomethyltransferase